MRLVSISGGATWGATFELIDDDPPADVVLTSPSTFVVSRGGLRYRFASLSEILRFAAEGETVHAFCTEAEKPELAGVDSVVIHTGWTVEEVYVASRELSVEGDPDRY